ncbi:unnamed protein product [Adineta ricciae]|uniref:Hexosyltransferase n=2 Tax=Adineta ricciae TaxID=249248 RepID=A0A813PBH7_ADIRI|nr:unnamed protein product [Adineta ricciae]CAF0752472.1 unnamed protein product [Adineta ricciae]
MFSSFNIHFALLVSCIIFLISIYSYLQHLENDHTLIPSSFTVSLSTAESSSILSSSLSVTTRQFSSIPDEQSLREKVLHSHEKDPSMLSRFTFINPPESICNYPNDTEQFMIIVVLSRAINFDYRHVIRATWGRNGKYKKSKIHIQTVFFVGTDDHAQAAVRDEQVLFHDVVEVGIPENYPFVAHKELASLLWTRYYCPSARIVFRADDDILLDIFLLLEYIEQGVDFRKKDGLYGWFRFNNTVHRADKWAVTKLEYSSTIYPPYTFGIGYLFSNVSCQRLVDAANHPNHEIIRIGDAYITGILRELANLPYYDFDDLQYAYTFYAEIPCEEYFENNLDLLICMSKLHIGLRGDPYQFYDAWDVILERNNLSLLTI